MNILKKLLGEDPNLNFIPKHFTRLPFSKTHGATEFKEILNWKVVEDIIDTKKSVLRIVQDGKVIKDYVDIGSKEAREHHQKGHTLLVRYAEKSSPMFNAIAQDFARSFHSDVDIQLYCTPEGHNAFGWHYDVEEVFIIQVQGSKAYTIRPNTVHPNPLVSSIPRDLGYENEKTPIEINVTLDEGDWLYIPSGWWHVAKTQKESMHISIGIMPSSAIDMVQYLPNYLAQKTFWRTRMPIHMTFKDFDEEISFYQDAMGKLGKNLAEEMSSKEFLESYLLWKKRLHQ
ncbi:JmjC domain-containing protein [Peredibacter sp. HCB2-198]|uniref:JmjC domain-containing protein n=1 Tax=Peredibacter sp. HCB2-198 TaxID=3383025 RepID=UPI0038B49EDC